jgi:hypothetical protein
MDFCQLTKYRDAFADRYYCILLYGCTLFSLVYSEHPLVAPINSFLHTPMVDTCRYHVETIGWFAQPSTMRPLTFHSSNGTATCEYSCSLDYPTSTATSSQEKYTLVDPMKLGWSTLWGTIR